MANEEVVKCDRCSVEIDGKTLKIKDVVGDDVYCENCHYDLYGKSLIMFNVK